MTVGGYDCIPEMEFDETWGARAKPNGDLFFLDEVRSFAIEYVWTVTEGEDIDESGLNADGSWYASPGIHVTNALGYLITEVPWRSDTLDAVWFLDDDEAAREERRS
jgi:hypothetical protein